MRTTKKQYVRFRLAKQQLCTYITLFCTFFAVVVRLQRETVYFHVLWRTWTQDNRYSPLELAPEKFLNVGQIE